MNPNGRSKAPLDLSGPQRVAILDKIGLSPGWLLLSISEMHGLKKAMNGATEENLRLNQQTTRMVARWIAVSAATVATMKSARAFFASLAENHPEPATRIDALNEVANLDAAIALFEDLPVNPKPSGQ